MRNFVTGMLFTAVMASAAGCSSKPAATCENAAAHIRDLAMNSEDFKKQPAEQQKAVMGMMDSLKEEFLKECKDKKWDAKTLDCIVSAKTTDEMQKCEPKK